MRQLTPSPLVPSAMEQAKAAYREAQLMSWRTTLPGYFEAIHRDSFRAGIDAVIALLRSPDSELVKAIADQIYFSSDGCRSGANDGLKAIARLLEARRG